MERNALHESSQYLLALAHEHGYNVSKHQLARWHRAGLLPRPKQLASGKAQGSQSLYPDGTSEQFLLLCALRTQERRISHLAWHLWWSGYPVALPLIKQSIEHASIQLSQFVQFLVMLKASEQTNNEVSDAILDFTERFAVARLNYKPLRHARKRIGKTYFPTFVRILLDVVSGTFEGYSTTYDNIAVMTDLHILAKGLGLHELFIRDHTNIEHYIGRFFVPLLQSISAWLKTLPWEKAVRTSSDFELMQARDNVRNAMLRAEHQFPYPSYLIRTYPTQSIALREIFQATTVGEQAMLLVFLLAVRRYEIS